jgi:hypothetical protein
MGRRSIAIILSIVTASGPMMTPAAAGTDAHCHAQDASAQAAALAQPVERTEHSAHHPGDHSEHDADPTMDGSGNDAAAGFQTDHSSDSSAHDCCDCACATGSGCTTFACLAASQLILADGTLARPDLLADANHPLGRGPPPSPPPIESSLQR